MLPRIVRGPRHEPWPGPWAAVRKVDAALVVPVQQIAPGQHEQHVRHAVDQPVEVSLRDPSRVQGQPLGGVDEHRHQGRRNDLGQLPRQSRGELAGQRWSRLGGARFVGAPEQELLEARESVDREPQVTSTPDSPTTFRTPRTPSEVAVPPARSASEPRSLSTSPTVSATEFSSSSRPRKRGSGSPGRSADQ